MKIARIGVACAETSPTPGVRAGNLSRIFTFAGRRTFQGVVSIDQPFVPRILLAFASRYLTNP